MLAVDETTDGFLRIERGGAMLAILDAESKPSIE
jgi:hypothetical protein